MDKRQIPKGLRDLLPQEVQVKREIENRMAGLLQSCGYVEVVTPTLERLEVIEGGTGRNIRSDLFLLTDREGGILALRPEMTVPIARLAATHLQEAVYPQRLFYVANVFRHVQPHLAHYREFWQAGIELIGADGPWADAEVIGLAVKSLQAIGLTNFKISLNHIGIFNGILAGSNMQAEERATIRDLVESKDLVQLHKVLAQLPLTDETKETIAKLPVLHGSIDIIEKIPYLDNNRAAVQAAGKLKQIYQALADSGAGEHIVIDMGVLRGLDYYTGVVFEGYSPELGYGLLGGGRYDNLMEQFGFQAPAVGFAVGLDRLALVMPVPQADRKRCIVGGQDFIKMQAKAEELRRQNYIAELDLEGLSRTRLLEKWNGQGAEVIFID